MKKIFTHLLLCASFGASAQAKFLDSSFHFNGLQDSLAAAFAPQQAGWAKTVALQPDGKILLVVNAQNKINLMRLNADGTKDAGFATGGLFRGSPTTTGSTEPTDVAVQPDGKILLLGHAFSTAQKQDVVLYRLLANGTPDNAFGTNGLVMTSTPGSNSYDYSRKVLLRPNGKIVVVGSTNTLNSDDKHLLVQYNTDGTLDAGFGTGGIAVQAPTGKAVSGLGGLLQPDGKIVVFGAQYAGSGSVGVVARYDSTGAVDDSFGTDGYREEIIHNRPATTVKDAALQSDGKMVLSLYAIPDSIHATRLSADGERDLSFGQNGLATLKPGGSSNWGFLEKIIVLPGDSLLFGCNAVVDAARQYDFTVVRLTPNGAVDLMWGDNGKVVADFHQDYDNLYGMAVQPDGKMVACGSSRQNDNTSLGYPSVARFKKISRSASSSVAFLSNTGIVLHLYPNPTTGALQIEGARAGDRVTLRNTFGQVVLQQTLTAAPLQLQSLSAGLYHLLVVRGESIIGGGRIVKE